VEVHSENFFGDGGRQLAVLREVRRDYPVSLHGVGLSLGSADPLDAGHLRRLARLVADVEPALVSEHLSWSSVDGVFTNDLLPLPATRDALAHVASRVGRVQDALGRAILLENVSSYLVPGEPEMTEWEFLAGIARRAGCGILLDVNNVYVSARNHGFDPRAYLQAMPRDLVGEIHLAGHSVVEEPGGTLLVDTHDAPVCDAVWALYASALEQLGPVPTLVEWDQRLPTLAELAAEACKADRLLELPRARVA
jgi:uncharacterized protein (UPF0276 family)